MQDADILVTQRWWRSPGGVRGGAHYPVRRPPARVARKFFEMTEIVVPHDYGVSKSASRAKATKNINATAEFGRRRDDNRTVK